VSSPLQEVHMIAIEWKNGKLELWRA
jgi:hypothetical protein